MEDKGFIDEQCKAPSKAGKSKAKQTALVEAKPRKLPMSLASAELATLCDMIDDGLEPDEAVTEVFKDCRMDLALAVDRRIVFDSIIDGLIVAAKDARDFWAERATKLGVAHTVFRKNIQEIIEARPDLPYEGRLGRFALQKNPPAVGYAFASSEVDPATIEFFGIDEKYVRTKVIKTIDTQRVAADLKAGLKLEWAELTQGQHVRIRTSKMPSNDNL